MIIWTRWGILAFLFVGVGVGLGFLLANLTGLVRPAGSINGVFVGIGHNPAATSVRSRISSRRAGQSPFASTGVIGK